MSPMFYVHPDGYLRLVGTGVIGAAWAGDPVLDATQRAALRSASTAAGKLTYVPNEKTTGLLPGTDMASLIPMGDGTTVVAGTWGTTPLSGRIVWGGLTPSSSGASSISNSLIAGPRPDLVSANPNSQAHIRDTSDNVKVWSAQHCVFSTLLWCIPELDPPGGAWDVDEALYLARTSIGLRGGRFQIQHCEFHQIQDPMNLAVTLTSLTTDELITNRAYFRHNWSHNALYYRGPLHSQPEGTHSDLCQWSRPQYMDIEYNLFGGPVNDLSGYTLTPSKETSDGAHNAGVMAQQEAYSSDLGMIRSVNVRRNIFWQHGPGGSVEGNGYNINHYYKTSNPNPMTDVLFQDNLHVQRADSKYLIRSSQYASLHSGHRIITTPVKASNGTWSWSDLGAVTPVNG